MLKPKVATASRNDVADYLACQCAQRLGGDHPLRGKRQMREIVAHPNYIVYYRVTASCIEVVNVIHTRREFPEQE